MSRPRTRRTAAAVKEYIDSAGGHCPCCGSKDIEPGRVQGARGRATGDFECFACHTRWRDVYTLDSVELLSGQDSRGQTAAPAGGVALASPTLDALLEAAEARAARAGDPLLAVADLRDVIRSAWRVMTPAQRTALSHERARIDNRPDVPEGDLATSVGIRGPGTVLPAQEMRAEAVDGLSTSNRVRQRAHRL